MNWQNLSDIVVNFTTATALVFGGIWAYILFIRQRVGLPRLHSTVLPEVFDSDSARLIRVEVGLENVGTVVVAPRQGEFRLRQVVPLPAEVGTAAAEGYDPVPDGQQQITWPMLAGRQWVWESGALEIEPGESESLHADFFVPEEVEVVEFYLFIANARKRRKALGWSRSQLWRVPRRTETTMAEVKLVKKSSSLVPLQQRQQKQQVAQQPQQQVQPKQPAQQQVQTPKGFRRQEEVGHRRHDA